jgi:hypothetical protein
VDTSQLLDYLVCLALSGSYYKEFDEKSKDFIEKSLELIDKKFTGIETISLETENEISGEKENIDLSYYKSFPTENKVYHKLQVLGKRPKLKFQ